MTRTDLTAHHGEFVVVETDDDHYVGTLSVGEDTVTIHTGFTGRPPIIDHDDIVTIVPADSHPLVEAI